eukprot:6188060-Pleurochrysis_carterae.AAC.6
MLVSSCPPVSLTFWLTREYILPLVLLMCTSSMEWLSALSAPIWSSHGQKCRTKAWSPTTIPASHLGGKSAARSHRKPQGREE